VRCAQSLWRREVDLASGGLKNLRRLAALDRYELTRHHHETASRKVETFRLGAFKKNRECRQDRDEWVANFRQDDPIDVRIPDLQSFVGTTQFSP
jgi:hypothetical protein